MWVRLWVRLSMAERAPRAHGQVGHEHVVEWTQSDFVSTACVVSLSPHDHIYLSWACGHVVVSMWRTPFSPIPPRQPRLAGGSGRDGQALGARRTRPRREGAMPGFLPLGVRRARRLAPTSRARRSTPRVGRCLGVRMDSALVALLAASRVVDGHRRSGDAGHVHRGRGGLTLGSGVRGERGCAGRLGGVWPPPGL